MALTPELRGRIQGIIDAHPVVVFMKGTKLFPRCGFSATVVEVLKRMGADFQDVDVLKDSDIREGVKEFSNWPTIPQVYVRGKFVGGCDIMRELYESGELDGVLGDLAKGRASA